MRDGDYLLMDLQGKLIHETRSADACGIGGFRAFL